MASASNSGSKLICFGMIAVRLCAGDTAVLLNGEKIEARHKPNNKDITHDSSQTLNLLLFYGCVRDIPTKKGADAYKGREALY